MTRTLAVSTKAREQMVDVTRLVQDAVDESGLDAGLVFCFVPHTTAAVTSNDSADPSVKKHILMILNRIVPWEADYRHLEGNSPAHLKSTIVGASELVAVESGRLVLGTWQGIFFCEFDGPRTRKVHLKLMNS